MLVLNTVEVSIMLESRVWFAPHSVPLATPRAPQTMSAPSLPRNFKTGIESNETTACLGGLGNWT